MCVCVLVCIYTFLSMQFTFCLMVSSQLTKLTTLISIIIIFKIYMYSYCDTIHMHSCFSLKITSFYVTHHFTYIFFIFVLSLVLVLKVLLLFFLHFYMVFFCHKKRIIKKQLTTTVCIRMNTNSN